MFVIRKFESLAKKNDRILGARVLLLFMKIFGIWHQKNEDTLSWRAAIVQNVHRYILHVPVSLTFCLLMWIETFQAPDLVQAGNVLYMSIAVSVYIVKLLSVWVLKAKVSKFFNDLEFNPVYELNTESEKDLWKSEQRRFNVFVALFICCSLFAHLGAFFIALIADDYTLGFDIYVPFEWRNPQYYWFAQAYDFAAMTVSCFSNIALDMLGCYMIFHIAILYKLLSMRLKELRTAGEKEIIEKLLKCLQLHRNIRRITKECEDLISPYAVSQIFFSGLIICFCGYRLQKMTIVDNVGQLFYMVQFISVMVLEVFLPCYFANEVTVNSSILLYNIYNLNWLDYPVATRKFIYLYMEFFKHPVSIRASNYFEIGLPVFTKVMNNAYTFLALLLNIDN